MPNRGDRGGSQTRARIAEIATALFLEHGFDQVTIAEVAKAAGVSKVTVFAHFERKEDLLLDRLPDVVALVRGIVQERPTGTTVVEAFRRATLDMAAQRHPLSGLDTDVAPFLRTVIHSPALLARLRTFEHEIESDLATALRDDPRFSGDAHLHAALLVATYRTVATATMRRQLAGYDADTIAAAHVQHLTDAFALLAAGLR
ncbi:helix-turn-helix domain-containing protein [Actinoplanes sp. NPDC051851]|uniref:TetR/AcrR family transcriptional regulator n=1 Tax=Actinoplanes sp. NPDC051851 TaxID=3154753 RepID=UPI00344409CF